MRIDGQRELHVPRDDVPGDAGESELLGLVDRLAIDRQARGEPHPPVVPRRLRVPLLGELEEEDGVAPNSGEPEPGCPLDVLGHGAAQEVHDVELATLEPGRARRLVGDALEDQALHARRLPPVALEGLDDDLDPRRGAHEPVGSGADRRFPEAVLADFLDVLLRHDPAGSGRGGPVKRHEVRPRLLHQEPDPARVDDLHVLDLVLEELRRPAAIAVEGELDVLGGDGIPVVELDPLAQQELVTGAIGGHRPGLREARRGRALGHGLHQRVVDRVEDLERTDGGLRLAGIEPAGCQRDVEGVRHLALGSGRLSGPHGHAERPDRGEQHGSGDGSSQESHLRPPWGIIAA